MKKIGLILLFILCLSKCFSQNTTNIGGSSVNTNLRSQFTLQADSGVVFGKGLDSLGRYSTMEGYIKYFPTTHSFWYRDNISWKQFANTGIIPTTPSWNSTLLINADVLQSVYSNFHNSDWWKDSAHSFQNTVIDDGGQSAFIINEAKSRANNWHSGTNITVGGVYLQSSNVDINGSATISTQVDDNSVSLKSFINKGDTTNRFNIYHDKITIGLPETGELGTFTNDVRIGTNYGVPSNFRVLVQDTTTGKLTHALPSDIVSAAGDFVTVNTPQTITAIKTMAPALSVDSSLSVLKIAPTGSFGADGVVLTGLRINTGAVSFNGHSSVANIPLQVSGGSSIFDGNIYSNRIVYGDTIAFNRDTSSFNPNAAIVIGDSTGKAIITSYNVDRNVYIGNNPVRNGNKLTVEGTTKITDTLKYTGAPLGTPVNGLFLDASNNIIKSPLSIFLDIFMVGGQSNASEFPADVYVIPDSTIAYLWRSGGTIVPLGANTIGVMWKAFAVEYYNRTGRKILFVQCALGGSSQVYAAQYLTGTWDIRPGNRGTLYDSAISMTDSALVTATNLGYKAELKGILWSQGEQDGDQMGVTITPADYNAALSYMLTNGFHIKYPSVPFYMWRTGIREGQTDATHCALVRQQQELVVRYDTLSKIVFRGTDTFTTANLLLRDNVHYSIIGYQMGGYSGASEVIIGWGKNQYEYFNPFRDTSGIVIANTRALYVTGKLSSTSVLTWQKSNLNNASFSLDLQSGGITMTNASGNNTSLTLLQQGTSTNPASASIHNMDMYGGSIITGRTQLATGANVAQINFRAPDASISPVNVANITTTIGTVTVASGRPVGILNIGTFDGTGSFTNKQTYEQTGRVSFNGFATRSGALTTTGTHITFVGGTDTDTATATGTIAIKTGINFSANTFSFSNTGVTVTEAFNLYVNAAPTAGTNATITRGYAFGVGAGGIKSSGPTTATASLNLPSGSNTPTVGQSGDLSNIGGILKWHNGSALQRFAKFTDATPTNGNILYGNGTDFSQLAIGSTGQKLTVVAGVPAWRDTTAVPTAANYIVNGTSQQPTSNFNISGTGAMSKVLGNSSTPSISAGAAAGSSPTITITGTDISGIISIVAGTSPTTGDLCDVTFTSSFPNSSRVVFSPTSTESATFGNAMYVTNSASGFSLNTTSALSAGITYTWNYIVIGK